MKKKEYGMQCLYAQLVCHFANKMISVPRRMLLRLLLARARLRLLRTYSVMMTCIFISPHFIIPANNNIRTSSLKKAAAKPGAKKTIDPNEEYERVQISAMEISKAKDKLKITRRLMESVRSFVSFSLRLMRE